MDLEREIRPTKMPRDRVLSIVPRAQAFSGVAMGWTIAGEEVIIIARRLSQLNVIANYLNPHGTLRTQHCPEVVVVSKDAVTLDDDL